MHELEDTENFNIVDYVNEHIYMFSGKTIQAVIKLDSAKTINDIIDWYGENISIKERVDGIYVSFAVNEQAFLYWALQYGKSIEIIKPITTRNKYIEMIENIVKKYKGDTNA